MMFTYKSKGFACGRPWALCSPVSPAEHHLWPLMASDEAVHTPEAAKEWDGLCVLGTFLPVLGNDILPSLAVI